MGWKYGAITGVVDILKGLLAVAAIRFFYGNNDLLAFLAGATAVIGHIFPYYLWFKGGKGAATLIGMTLMFDYRIGLLMALTIVLITIITDYIAIGSVIMYSLLPVVAYIMGYSNEIIIIAAVLAIISYFKHVKNFIRISKNEEKGLRSVVKK